jgi:hypothetical protein
MYASQDALAPKTASLTYLASQHLERHGAFQRILVTRGSRDTAIGVAMGYGLDRPCSIPGIVPFSLIHNVQIASGATQPHIQLLPGALSPGVKRQRREADHSPPSSAEDKKGGAIPPFLHVSMA